MHVSPFGQVGRQSVPHGVTPSGQLGAGQLDAAQSAGRVRFPKQSWQGSQVFRHPVTCVHGLQRAGSSRCAASQDGVPVSSIEPSQTA